MNPKYTIISRHDGAVEWLRRRGIEGRIVDHAIPADVRGRHVVGALPLQLAAMATSVSSIVFDCPRELRGQDLNAEQLDSLGAHVETFYVVSAAQAADIYWSERADGAGWAVGEAFGYCHRPVVHSTTVDV